MANWWDNDLKTEQRGIAALKSAKSLVKDQSWRLAQQLKRWSVYYGRPVRSIEEAGALRAVDGKRDLPFAAAVVHSAVAKIAGKQRPIPIVCTSGASYKTRLQARKLSKFLKGQFYQSQGCYQTIWELGQAAFTDSCVSEAGVVRVRADVPNERVAYDRRLAIDIYFDPIDSETGSPTQLLDVYRYPRASLAAAYPKHKLAIDGAPAYSRTGTVRQGDLTGLQHVAVYELFKLPDGKNMPGRHLLLIESSTGPLVLLDEEWKRQRFPYAFLVWDPALVGPWGMPQIDQAELPHTEANYAYGRAAEGVRLGAGGFVAVTEDTLINEQALTSNESYKILKMRAGAPMPQVSMPAPFNQSTLDFGRQMQSLVNELTGVNELSSQGKLPPGMTSGVSQRNYNELQGERFLTKSQRFENFHATLGTLSLDAVQDLDAAGVKPTSWLPSEGLITEIDWQDIKLEGEDLYEVQIQSGNDLVNQRSALLQFVSELRANGQLPPDVADRMIRTSETDMEAVNSRVDAQENWLERIIGEIHDHDDEDEEIETEPPDPMMDLGAAATTMRQAYLECCSWPDSPENKKRAMRNWITDCISMLTASQSAPAPAAPPPEAMGPPPAAAPMGAPPPMM